MNQLKFNFYKIIKKNKNDYQLELLPFHGLRSVECCKDFLRAVALFPNCRINRFAALPISFYALRATWSLVRRYSITL